MDTLYSYPTLKFTTTLFMIYLKTRNKTLFAQSKFELKGTCFSHLSRNFKE